MRRAESRLKTENRAQYEGVRRQSCLAEQRASPTHNWIRQVAAGQLETEAVMIDDPDFLVLPDIRKKNAWGDGDVVSLNLLVIFKDPTLQTIRDLRATHLPVLQRIQGSCLETIETKCGVSRDEVYAYFNYLPSNPVLLHLHLAWPLPSSRDSLRHHLLSTVIYNLTVCPQYYEDCPLSFIFPKPPRGLEDLLGEMRI